MKISQDRFIQIALVVVIVILIGAVVFAGRGKNGLPSAEEVEFSLAKNNVEFIDESDMENELTESEPVPVQPSVPKPVIIPQQELPTVSKITSFSACYPKLSGKKSDTYRGVLLNWTTCPDDDFQFYKVVRSVTNSNPMYPNDSVILSSANRSYSNYIDKTVAPYTTYYYRVCVVQRLNKVACGNRISVKY